jgi:hypothetical protein
MVEFGPYEEHSGGSMQVDGVTTAGLPVVPSGQ